MEYQCSICACNEFIRLETINIDSNRKAVQTTDGGVLKCSNCGRRITVAEDGEISVLQDSPGSLTAQTLPQKVRSSVTADDRGVNSGVRAPAVPLEGVQRKF